MLALSSEALLTYTQNEENLDSIELNPTGQDPVKPDELRKARLAHWGAQLAFQEFSNNFGSKLISFLTSGHAPSVGC